MTICPDPATTTVDHRCAGLLLVRLGGSPAATSPSASNVALEQAGAGDPDGLERAAARLEAMLAVRRLVLEDDGVPEPDRSLSRLAAEACAGQRPWIAALPMDVGRPLADGGTWAQALGAWRQPVVLVIPAVQLGTGLPAAGTALLRQWQVPLVGLLQWGGLWQPGPRQADGLSWLGMLPEGPAAAEADPSLSLALRLRLGDLLRS
ncbi:MAG: hypothetical protein ACKO0M_02705 [Cyanobium sp.]